MRYSSNVINNKRRKVKHTIAADMSELMWNKGFLHATNRKTL
jgi:hypothetical protein